MKENLTEVLFALNSAAVPQEQAEDAVKGFKGFVSAMKKREGEVRISAVTFGNGHEFAVDNVPAGKIKAPELKFGDNGGGACAMVDAVSDLMDSVGVRLNDTAEEERPSQIIVAIFVIGRDNASKNCTYEELKEKIAIQRDIYKWKFYLVTDFSINMEKLGIAEEDTLLVKRTDDSWLAKPMKEVASMISELLDSKKN